MNNHHPSCQLISNPLHVGARIQKYYEILLSDREMIVEEARLAKGDGCEEAYEEMRSYISGLIVQYQDTFGEIIEP